MHIAHIPIWSYVDMRYVFDAAVAKLVLLRCKLQLAARSAHGQLMQSVHH